MIITAAFVRLFEAVRLLRERAETDRILSGLPVHIRKDIGWPSTDLRPSGRRGFRPIR